MLDPQSFSRFLPAERLPQETIEKSYKEILSFDNLNVILNAVSAFTVIINAQRQIIFANSKAMEVLGLENIKELLGQRTGEILSCKYADKYDCGCGTTEECKLCGAAQAIKESMEASAPVQKECRIMMETETTHKAYDFEVTASPLKHKSSKFIILTFTDISDTKRRQWLESIFYHDIINIAGGISGLLEMLEMTTDQQKQKKYIKMASVTARNLIDEILSQRSLQAAENGSLELSLEKAGSLEMINEVITIMEGLPIAKNKKIIVTHSSSNISFTTDTALMKRILINLVKNAVEASREGETIVISCSKADDIIEFSINNPGKMPEDVQYQIFQRSFSTKGNSRGLGTYSVKLLTERFLNGKVTFSSEERRGTTFIVRFPIHVNPVNE